MPPSYVTREVAKLKDLLGIADKRPETIALGLRKFTSSELLDAGFNLSAVAERQGHGPQVLAKHRYRTPLS